MEQIDEKQKIKKRRTERDGVMGIVGIVIAAMQNPPTQRVKPPGKMIISILENGLLVLTILALVLLGRGLYILLKEDKQC